MDLRGQTAIVTGGAVRLGRAISLALADAGCCVVLHYGSSADAAVKTLSEIHDRGVKAVSAQADLQNPAAAAESIFNVAVAEFGGADILINNAAIFEEGDLLNTTAEQWDRHFRVNLQSAFVLSQEFVRRHETGKPGQIVNIADWRATRPVPGHLAYTLSKVGLVALTKILAQELAPGIRVNAVAPGAVLPPPDADENTFDQIARRNPLQRMGNPDEVTAAILYLLRADFLTGEVIHVTGGEQL
ncbi:MAG: SDR family oxidoreductase [Planctomycetes bacterium]|nr:SDR family oxidoreductase [Planctomycetota bacterium]